MEKLAIKTFISLRHLRDKISYTKTLAIRLFFYFEQKRLEKYIYLILPKFSFHKSRSRF